MSQTNLTTMVRSIFGGMCWIVDPAGNHGILVFYCSVFVAESSFCLQYACLRGEIHRVSARTAGVVSILETLVPIPVVRYLK